MPKAFFVVRAIVADPADRPGFDDWYRTEHLPEARIAFGATSAWRCWNQNDPREHLAFYGFDDPVAAKAIPVLPALRELIAEFDRVWGNRVTRSREVLVVAD
jgi:hypothetical protein